MNRLPLTFVLLGGLLASCGGTGSGSVSIIGVDPRGELTVDVSGLPSGAAADVTVQSKFGSVDLTGGQVLRDLPLGTYSVSARTVMADGAPYLAVVTPEQTTFTEKTLRATVKVQYDLPLVGALTLNVAGVPAGQSTMLHLNGPDGFTKTLPGVATQTLEDLAPGTYTLTADAIRDQDFTYPAAIQPTTITVQRGRTAVGNVSFARDPRYGNLGLRVLGLPDGVTGVVTAQMAGGAPRTRSGSGLLTDLPVGTYALTPADAHTSGLTYRAPGSSVAVPSASTAFADVTYAPITGRLRVVVNSPVPVPAGVVSVTGTAQASVGVTATTTLDDLVPGDYAVQAATFQAGGWTYVSTVTPGTASVVAGNTAGATVTYLPLVTQPGLKRDFTPPALTLDGLDGDVLYGTASDAEGSVTVQVYVGTEHLGDVTPVNGQWSLTWPASQSGATDVTVIATDASGNSSRVTGTFGR
ncbi:hypothetical protein HNQ07_004365 [Deinococcus metalli]|uniref:Uncharacterized protein n=1 Tax=Deinococcus metalli TaxID=1141878 RepID=A0A7W8NT91_9DEIO|nr:hypothetical protein [Deinococcus metalli]MBB5378858.1 hypothetical protein [Deinococcus metalli]GHF62219.1 hypothetical protein GCM10017781_42880 [Deinococcus metalli]